MSKSKTVWLNRALGWRVEQGGKGWALYNGFGYAGTFKTLAEALRADGQMGAEPQGGAK